MDTRTGNIRELADGEEPGPNEIAITREQREAMERIAPEYRPDSIARQIEELTAVHQAARPDGLTDDEWRAQKNAAKRIRRELRG